LKILFAQLLNIVKVRVGQVSLLPDSNPVLLFKAYNVLAAQIEQTRQLGQKLEAKILDVRDVDVSNNIKQLSKVMC